MSSLFSRYSQIRLGPKSTKNDPCVRPQNNDFLYHLSLLAWLAGLAGWLGWLAWLAGLAEARNLDLFAFSFCFPTFELATPHFTMFLFLIVRVTKHCKNQCKHAGAKAGRTRPAAPPAHKRNRQNPSSVNTVWGIYIYIYVYIHTYIYIYTLINK